MQETNKAGQQDSAAGQRTDNKPESRAPVIPIRIFVVALVVVAMIAGVLVVMSRHI